MPADGRHLRKYVPPRELIERGPGRVAKPEVLEARPAGPLHLAAAGEYNRIAEKWEKLEEKLEELLANLKADSENLVNGGLREEVLMCHVDERALPLEWTPLQYAARHGSTDDVRRLLDIGADVSTRDVHGSTPLHNAARSGVEAVEKIRVLFEAGANLDAPDRYGMRPLHVAASCEKPKAARELVLLGCTSGAKDCPLLDGDSAWNVADRFGATQVCEVMKANERRRLKLAGGNTQLVHADSIFLRMNVPGAFTPKRMSTKPATWETAME